MNTVYRAIEGFSPMYLLVDARFCSLWEYFFASRPAVERLFGNMKHDQLPQSGCTVLFQRLLSRQAFFLYPAGPKTTPQ